MKGLSFVQKHWKLTVVILVILIVIGVWAIRLFTPTSGFVFDTVKKTTLTEVVSDSGKITIGGRTEVYSPTNGIVRSVYVENGKSVEEDTTLFTVESSATPQEQQNAYAAYQTAVAAQNTAETLLHTYRSNMYIAWKTYMDMAQSGTYESSKGIPDVKAREAAEFQSTQDNWLAAEKQFKDQEQAVNAAQAQLNATWTAYLATQSVDVPAPVTGIVQNLAVTEGSSVKALTMLSPDATAVLTLIESPKVEAVLQIGQTDIAKVKTGQEAIIHPDSYKDKEFKGRVIRVDTIGQDMQGVIVYNVYIDFSDTTEELMSGMTVDGDITTATKTSILTVPNAAVVIYKDQKAVRVIENNKLVYVPVVIGMKGQSRTEIVKGVKEGQQVVVALTNTQATRPGFLGL